MRLILLLLLSGCVSTPLTPLEEIEREMAEQERQEYFILWREWCRRHGIIYVNNAWTCPSMSTARGRNCIPAKQEWRYTLRDNPDGTTTINVLSNTYACKVR